MTIDFDNIRSFANVEFLAKQLVEGFITGLHKSPYHGFSVEFAEHNLYNSGESTRHIDWKVYAKTDRLYTKRYEEETNLRCYLIVDHSASMYYPSSSQAKIKFSTLATAAIAYMLFKQRDAFGLFTFSDGIDYQSEVKSTSTHLRQLYTNLSRILDHKNTSTRTDVATTLHEIARKIHRRSLVILFSDMFQNQSTSKDELFSALQHLKHNKHEVLLFHVSDKLTEMEFDFEDRPYEFVDLESGQIVKLTPTAVKNQYKQAMASYYNELKSKCGQLKIDFIEADVRKSFDEILSAFLIKRAKMR